MISTVEGLPFKIGSVVKFCKEHMCVDMYELTFGDDSVFPVSNDIDTYKRDSKMRFQVHKIKYDEKYNSNMAIKVVDVKHKDKISDWMDIGYFVNA